MLQHLLLDPRIVLEVLCSIGCVPGPSNESLQAISNPNKAGLTDVLDLGGPMDGETIESHLSNLELSPEDFLREFERFKTPFTS